MIADVCPNMSCVMDIPRQQDWDHEMEWLNVVYKAIQFQREFDSETNIKSDKKFMYFRDKIRLNWLNKPDMNEFMKNKFGLRPKWWIFFVAFTDVERKDFVDFTDLEKKKFEADCKHIRMAYDSLLYQIKVGGVRIEDYQLYMEVLNALRIALRELYMYVAFQMD